uniref:O-methyltransferase n=1 Tax=Tricholoma matsutake TaxID=40145 RepID=A0A348G6V1_TRIMT|nr:O-methyltransferase [Tricholoma matsutake]BBF98763.1 O-methyltransferase [Tricholoma matsutake]
MSQSTDISYLRQLVQIITENVDAIERLAYEQGVTHPTIDDLCEPTDARETFTLQPDVIRASTLATSAASQLVATLKLPNLVLRDRANAYHVPCALRIASETGIVELFREAGPKGMHIKDIATQAKVEPSIIGRVLRLLATHYIFKEVEPNVFANNRISSAMDTGKARSKILSMTRKKVESPAGFNDVVGDKYLDTNGIAAFVEQTTDIYFKSSACLPELVIANDYSMTALQKAMQFDGTFWDFLNKYPGSLQRFQSALGAWNRLQPTEVHAFGFDWPSLPEGSLIVDVGGGDGTEVFAIAQIAPHVKLMVQDRDQTIQQVTTPTWLGSQEKSRMIDSGQVTLLAHDFREAQPSHLVNKPAVFFMRHVTHNWPTNEIIHVLKHLHAAAPPHCKLIIADQLVPHACPDTQTAAGIKRVVHPMPPAPLLANLGEANAAMYSLDLAMTLMFNSQERTLGEFKEMTEAAGWKIQEVYQTARGFFSQLVCTKL